MKTQTNTWTIEKLLETSGAYWNACTIHAAIRLDVFSKLYTQPLSISQLAKECACDARGMELLVTALAGMGLVDLSAENATPLNKVLNSWDMGLLHVDAEKIVALSTFARQYLCRQSPEYMGYILLHVSDCMPAWQQLHESVKTGRPHQNFVSEHQDQEREHFLLGMHNLASKIASEIANTIPLQGKKHLLDLGGATGTYAMQFCKQHPELHATIFDLPTTEHLAQKVIAENKMQDRIQFVGGNFMQDAIPTGFDAVWISHILHAFSPKECRELLAKVWANIPTGAMLYIQEFVLNDERNGPEYAGLFGLNMLVYTQGGQTYSTKDIYEMLQELGAINISRLNLNLPSDADIIQAQKA